MIDTLYYNQEPLRIQPNSFSKKVLRKTFKRVLGDFPGGSVVKNLPAKAGAAWRCRFDTQVWKIPWRRKWQPTPVFLPKNLHGQKSLADYSPRGHKELDTAEQLHTQAHLQMSRSITLC